MAARNRAGRIVSPGSGERRTTAGQACARSQSATAVSRAWKSCAAEAVMPCPSWLFPWPLRLPRSRKIGQGSRMYRKSRQFRRLRHDLAMRPLLRSAAFPVARGSHHRLSIRQARLDLDARPQVLHEKVTRDYVPLDRMSPNLLAAVVMSEDAHFCRHHGVDWGALREVIDVGGIGGASRGASTITMQVAKNLFLWPGRSYVRKAFEIPLALVARSRLAETPHPRNLSQHRRMGRWNFRRRGRRAGLFPQKRRRSQSARGGAARRASCPTLMTRSVLHPNWRVTIHARVVVRRVVRSPGSPPALREIADAAAISGWPEPSFRCISRPREVAPAPAGPEPLELTWPFRNEKPLR